MNLIHRHIFLNVFLTCGASVAMFGFVLMLALGGAMLIGGSAGGQANSALFSVVWTLLPVWFASSYVSYREVFSDNGASGEPAESSTIRP